MAQISGVWKTVRVPSAETVNWRATKTWLEKADAKMVPQSVYVIRTTKPFAIAYEKKASPVMYIGEGDFGTRLKSHLKNWIQPLVQNFKDLTIEVCFVEIKVNGNSSAYKDVEADLLWRFAEKYGSVPLMNRQFEYHSHDHVYDKSFFKPIQSEKGAGYLWAIRPLISNMAYAASLKGLLN